MQATCPRGGVNLALMMPTSVLRRSTLAVLLARDEPNGKALPYFGEGLFSFRLQETLGQKSSKKFVELL